MPEPLRSSTRPAMPRGRSIQVLISMPPYFSTARRRQPLPVSSAFSLILKVGLSQWDAVMRKPEKSFLVRKAMRDEPFRVT